MRRCLVDGPRSGGAGVGERSRSVEIFDVMAGKHAAGVTEKRSCDETFAASGLERFSPRRPSLDACGEAGLFAAGCQKCVVGRLGAS